MISSGVRGFVIGLIVMGAAFLAGMWWLERPIEVVVTCKPQTELFSMGRTHE